MDPIYVAALKQLKVGRESKPWPSKVGECGSLKRDSDQGEERIYMRAEVKKNWLKPAIFIELVNHG